MILNRSPCQYIFSSHGAKGRAGLMSTAQRWTVRTSPNPRSAWQVSKASLKIHWPQCQAKGKEDKLVFMFPALGPSPGLRCFCLKIPLPSSVLGSSGQDAVIQASQTRNLPPKPWWSHLCLVELLSQDLCAAPRGSATPRSCLFYQRLKQTKPLQTKPPMSLPTMGGKLKPSGREVGLMAPTPGHRAGPGEAVSLQEMSHPLHKDLSAGILDLNLECFTFQTIWRCL